MNGAVIHDLDVVDALDLLSLRDEGKGEVQRLPGTSDVAGNELTCIIQRICNLFKIS